MRGLWSTLGLVVVLAGLGGYIYFVDSKRPASTTTGDEPARTKLFTVEADKITDITLTAKGQKTVLHKAEGGWKMTAPVQSDADPPEVISLAQAIANLESVRDVDDNPADLKEFGLADAPMAVVEFKAEGGASGSFTIGSKNPTGGERYAMKGGEKKVFLVSSFVDSNFDRDPLALRDKKILKFDRDKADSLTLAKGADSLELARDGSEWKMLKPVAVRSDYSAIEGLMTRLASSNMATIVEENAPGLAKYGLDKPVMTVTIGAGSAKTVLQVGKTEADRTYAKDASRPIVFTVDSTLQGDFIKPFDEYRKKELFELRAFTVAKIRAVLDAPAGPKTYEIEKVPAAKPGESESWKVTRVGGATHTPDTAAVDDLLTKLVAVKAESFVTGATKTGLDKPALVVSASYDDGKFERVRFGAVSDNAYGARDGEPGVAKVETNAMKALLSAFDVVTIPPAPPEKKTEDKK